MKKILFSLLAISFCFSLMAQTALLRMNPEKNRVYRLRSLTNQTVSQTINGNQQTTESKVDYVFSMKMMDVTPDFFIAEIHFDTIITKTNAMGKQINISSAVEGNIASGETSEIMSCIMNRLSKNAVYTKVDFTGKPVEILNGKLLSDMILKDTSSITLKEPLKAALRSQIEGTVSDNSLKTMIGMFTWNLPANEVKAGDEWTNATQTSSGGMTLDIKTKYHLLDIKGDLANVTAESNIKAAENAPPIKSGGATVTYDNLQGLSKSSLVLNVRTGLVVESKGQSHITGNLGISGPGFSMQMPMDINSESTITALQ
jgi:hypothetical protein